MSARLRHTYHPDLADQPEKPFTVDADDIKHFPMSPFRPPHLGNFQPSHRGAEKYRHFVGRPNLRDDQQISRKSRPYCPTRQMQIAVILYIFVCLKLNSSRGPNTKGPGIFIWEITDVCSTSPYLPSRLG